MLDMKRREFIAVGGPLLTVGARRAGKQPAMGAEEVGVQPDAANPLGDEPRAYCRVDMHRP